MCSGNNLGAKKDEFDFEQCNEMGLEIQVWGESSMGKNVLVIKYRKVQNKWDSLVLLNVKKKNRLTTNSAVITGKR